MENEQKKELTPLPTEESSKTMSLTTNDGSMKQASGQVKKHAFKHIGKILNLASKVHAFALKFYDEQLPDGWPATLALIKSMPKDYIIIAICHDRDTYAEDGSFWKTALEKRHYHVLIKCKDWHDTVRVSTMMDMLHIYYRPMVDDELWKNHGCETIGKSFSGYATYLTHETEAAIRDGKERYELDELISNYSIDEIKQIREGYIRLQTGTQKLTSKDLAEIDSTAYTLGYELRDFENWYDSLGFNVRSNCHMKTIRESYQRGVNKRIDEKAELLRTCVFIKGVPNAGKSYNSQAALRAMGKTFLDVGGGGSGKFDKLKPSHDAIIISDDVCPNLLNMTDNFICRAYKRQSDNPAWAGQFFIVTSNLDFDEWIKSCGIKSAQHVKAMRTRFFICEIVDNNGYELRLSKPSMRGTPQNILDRMNLFQDFQKHFNESLAEYKPIEFTFDLHEQHEYYLQKKKETAERQGMEFDAGNYSYEWFVKNIDNLVF